MSQQIDNWENQERESSQAAVAAGMFRVVWRGKWLIAIATLLGFAGAYVDYSRRVPVFQTSSQVLVVRKKPEVLPVAGVDSSMSTDLLDDYLGTHMVLIKSPLIVKRAVEEGDLKSLPSFGGGDPTHAIIGGLTIARDAKNEIGQHNNILTISFRGTNPADCVKVLAAVIKSYQSFLDETYRNVSEETAKIIHDAREILQKELAEKHQRYQDFRQKAPLLRAGKDGSTLQHDTIANVQVARSGLLLKKAELEGQIQALETAQEKGKHKEALAAIMPDLARTAPETQKSPPPGAFESQLLALLIEERALAKNVGPEHPRLVDVREKIEFTRELMDQPASTWAFGRKPELDAEADHRAKMDQAIRGLKQRIENTGKVEESLSGLFNRQHEEAKKMDNYLQEEEFLKDDIRRTQDLFNLVLKRGNEVNLVKDMGGFSAKVISPAEGAGLVEPNFSRIMTMGGFIGAMIGLALAYLAELMDRTFRSPEEISRRLQLPVIGHIPQLAVARAGVKDETGRLSPVLCTHHRPRSMEAEAYRGVRTAIYFSTRGQGHQVIQVTSPNVADGKTTLTGNLAVSIAQSGKRVLLVDADFRRPKVHKLFGQSPEVGLVSAIAGQADLADVIQATDIAGLSILPCGPIPANPAELLTSPRFKKVIDEVREHYDFVLIDTPPLLAVTDPSVVAPRVDSVLLTIRITKNGRPHAERAKEVLESVGANVLGVVVNGVGENHSYGRHGYGGYRYRYGYGYDREYTNEEPTAMDSSLPPPAVTKTIAREPLSATRVPTAPPARSSEPADAAILRKWEQAPVRGEPAGSIQ